jgi:hypothetical protein
MVIILAPAIIWTIAFLASNWLPRKRWDILALGITAPFCMFKVIQLAFIYLLWSIKGFAP